MEVVQLTHLQAALSLWIFLIHDALLLGSLLLLPPGLSGLLPLGVGLLQEVLLNAGTVPVSLQFALHTETHKGLQLRF